ncbi:MAG: hypothetical protein MUD14_17295 [Hydrococcus sp. Prado102]|jgi:hypothetical protein|nr:hypothetical protein [Hydrococcus sp. Prado102]
MSNPEAAIASSQKINRWEIAHRSVAQSKLWSFLLIAIGSASSLISPHSPLVGFATVAGISLTRQKAIAIPLLVWLVNQIYGFTVRQYPQTIESLIWGLVMGAGTIVVALIAIARPQFSRERWTGHCLWLGITFLSGYVLFEGLVFLAGLSMGQSHVFTLAILWGVFVKEFVWAIALGGIHALLLILAMRDRTAS